ncbi:DUF4876 domain-containing protein [Hymenobacter sp. UYP22]|uniref:DUF4876 domain-containing protein n=1 Tax=Hymenobacter sp. UYP22 TaxID=3156348 RepID=UPI00339953A3
MKHLRTCLLALLAPLWLGSCEKNDPETPAASAAVTITFDAAYANTPAERVAVKIENINTRESLTATTDAQGTATFGSIPAGAYNVTARREMTPAEFLAFAGTQVSAPVLFQASELNKTFAPGQPNPVTLTLKAGTSGELLIKQIYYAGSDRVNGAVFRDQFIELYNNTDAVLYADGLYLAQIDGNRSVPTSALPAFLLPSGQYDWSKSLGMPLTVRANEDFVYTRTLFQIPGTGQQYPVQPGQSIVIAQSAQNHKSPFTGNGGTSITVRDPSLTVDLSNASFEAFFGRGLDSDLDNPAVPNLRLVQTVGTDMILDNLGRDGYAIFRSMTDAATFKKYPRPNTTTITSSTLYYYQVPKSMILDAVECQESPTQLLPKRFTAELDAGYTFGPAGSYTSQSVIRKVARTFGTRRILQDTNNSTTDFQVLNRPVPFGF